MTERTLTPADLNAIEARARAATPGPYGLVPPGGPQGNFYGIWNPTKGWIVLDRVLTGEANARYFAALDPDTVLALVALARRAERLEADNLLLLQERLPPGRTLYRIVKPYRTAMEAVASRLQQQLDDAERRAERYREALEAVLAMRTKDGEPVLDAVRDALAEPAPEGSE